MTFFQKIFQIFLKICKSVKNVPNGYYLIFLMIFDHYDVIGGHQAPGVQGGQKFFSSEGTRVCTQIKA